MCTAVSFCTNDHYFGRNLDYEHSYDEQIIISPRNFCFEFRKSNPINSHYAIIGMAAIRDGYPLYYDGANEKGLSMAGLLFPSSAVYHNVKPRYDNITPFEFIPYILSQCESVGKAKELLKTVNLIDVPFSKELPLSPLHWIISDKNESIVIESVSEGLNIYDNPVGVLTNNPPFPMQLFNLNNYMSLSPFSPQNTFSQKLQLCPYSRGMGAMGMPGDLSSASRFVRSAFILLNSVSGESEQESVSQFFHILQSVSQTRGCVHMGKNLYEFTLYSSCINTDKGIYYYTTYDNQCISGVDMYKEDLDCDTLKIFPLKKEWYIFYHNNTKNPT